ncbi:hypothetical protein L9F63_016742, partial [Diploptera punctata]
FFSGQHDFCLMSTNSCTNSCNLMQFLACFQIFFRRCFQYVFHIIYYTGQHDFCLMATNN